MVLAKGSFLSDDQGSPSEKMTFEMSTSSHEGTTEKTFMHGKESTHK